MTFPPAEVLQQLQRIATSEGFRRANRLRRLLTYVVEEKLAGRSDQIKEYSIGVHAFGLGADFDGSADPIVRIQARNLRARLDEYYSTGGAQDRLIIELVKGSYDPQFHYRAAVTQSGPSAPTSVAVLPFRDLTNEPSFRYLSEGVTDGLIDELSRIPGLRVMARTSSSAFRDTEFDIREMSARLGVAFLIEGSVRHNAGRLEVRARLIEAATGFQKWSATRDVDAAQSLWLPRQVSPEIARELGLASQGLPGTDISDFGAAGRRTIDAYDAYRRARYHWAERTRDGVRTAMALYQQAIAADPSYSEARSGLADIYVMLAIYGHLPPDMAMPTAKRLALEALELNPESAEAHTTMGMIAGMYDWQHDAARESFLRAIELRPCYPDAHQWYANFHLLTVGRFEEAIREHDTALLYDPLSLTILGDRGNTLSLAGRHEEGLEACLQVQARDPQSFRIYWQLGLIYERMGRMQEAIDTFERCRELSTGDPFECNAIGSLGHTLGLVGRKDDALACIADLEKLALLKRYNPLAIALVHVGMGHTDDAFKWLNLAANARIGVTAWVAVDPRAARIKDDLRFRLLLERFGLSDSEQTLR